MNNPIVKIIVVSIFILPLSCQQENKAQERRTITAGENSSVLKNKQGTTIRTRFLTPQNFERLELNHNSFAGWLQDLPLKPEGSKVHYYDGRTKPNEVYQAVADLDIGTKNLQQCADAVIRLRAEFLFAQKKYDAIHFNFTNGFVASYSKWQAGYRISVNGNNCTWILSATPDNSYASFRKYLDLVFSYAGTLSLEKELKPKNIADLKAGDVFIHGGSPGHAVIVIEVVKDKQGNKMFMLAQSYMPAQDIQILKNISNPELSPWYPADFDGKLQTPEWTFERDELRGWDK